MSRRPGARKTDAGNAGELEASEARPIAAARAPSRASLEGSAAAAAGAGRAAQPELDFGRLGHLMGLKTSLVDARLRRAFHQGMRDLRLRPVDFTILLLLADHDGVSQKALCRKLDISPPGLAVILDRLQARRLLVRVRNESDRREHRLSLTEAGAKLAAQAESRSHELEREVLASLTPAEEQELARLLTKLLP